VNSFKLITIFYTILCQ